MLLVGGVRRNVRPVSPVAVFAISMAMVMGPTPPGTGVISLRGAMRSRSRRHRPTRPQFDSRRRRSRPSPAIRSPLFASTRLRRRPGCPHSPRRRDRAYACGGVTVAWRSGGRRRPASTSTLRPTTRRAGLRSAPTSSRRRIASKVQDRKPGSPASSRPWLIGCRPSTSLAGSAARQGTRGGTTEAEAAECRARRGAHSARRPAPEIGCDVLAGGQTDRGRPGDARAPCCARRSRMQGRRRPAR
jgi:hypothetical protein